MGRPKQLLMVEGEQLIRKTIQAALASRADEVMIVLGFSRESVQTAIADLPVTILFHEHWTNGMGSTLKLGLQEILKKKSQPVAILLLVCDQPHLTTSHLDTLINHYRTSSAPVIASVYQGNVGVPAIFDQSVFQELLTIDDQHGAKQVIKKFSKQCLTVPFPGGEFDLDTPEDYTQFLHSKNQK
jgi:molybdenum cofactor cytidylyltransferase